MDYVVGSVAALVSGNVTPNRPKFLKRALTPTKHAPSPNVTPKSEAVDDRSIFLSPTLQKKKAIVKKSPKRIFQNPDLDITEAGENVSPIADKVKKHLQNELEADSSVRKKVNEIPLDVEPSNENLANQQVSNESTPKKKKKSRKLALDSNENPSEENLETLQKDVSINSSTHKKKKLAKSSSAEKMVTPMTSVPDKPSKKSHNNTEPSELDIANNEASESVQDESKSNKKKKRKNKKKQKNDQAMTEPSEEAQSSTQPIIKKTKNHVNPNAITDKDSDSEHDSDNEVESENDAINKEILNAEPNEPSSDEEEEQQKVVEKPKAEKIERIPDADEAKRTLFVGNVPFSKKCKKEIKKIFNKYGQIETIRIRTVPVKDGRVTPKLAVIKNELHPERTTVNVYVKFQDPDSVVEALAENNTVMGSNHLRVTRSDVTGAPDSRCAVFVGNLPFALEDDALRDKFSGCGDIISVRIVRDKKTNAGKGFGYVNFASKDGVELALALTEEDLTIKNRILRVKRCTDSQKTNKNNQGMRHNQGNRNSQGNQNNYRNKNNYGNQNNQWNRNNENNQRNRNNENNQRNRNNENNQWNRNTENNQWNRNNENNQYRQNPGNSNYQRGNKVEGRKFGYNQGQNQRFGGNPNEQGAFRRIMKRKNNDSSGGPPNKVQNMNQPSKEKKPKKEFVGVTAEKKKKQKFNKGQKKKKNLSEILTK